jgi:hypothetical protein
MFGLPVIAEQVTRHRGGGRDENGRLIPSTSTSLTAIGVAPGAGSERLERGRDGEDIAYTAYFPTGTDLLSADELTLRGQRFRIVVNEWRTTPPLPGGLEVLCMRAQG